MDAAWTTQRSTDDEACHRFCQVVKEKLAEHPEWTSRVYEAIQSGLLTSIQEERERSGFLEHGLAMLLMHKSKLKLGPMRMQSVRKAIFSMHALCGAPVHEKLKLLVGINSDNDTPIL